MLRRRNARLNLIPFTEYTLPNYEPAQHHHRIAAALECVESGETKRLMINMPPRHGKSELASRRFPAWYIGRNPNKQIITASYSSDLATDFGREVRNIVASKEFGRIFSKVRLAQDSQAAWRWNTNKGGAYVAAGVGTGISGRGADVLLIDDPFKDRQEADSETTRQRVWDWYTSTAYTRLMPGGSIVIIQTRWHEDDLSGRLLEAMEAGGEQWEVLSLPALSAGQALWPGWFDAERLGEIQRAIGHRDWSALYQQQPAPEEGTFFQRDWFHRHVHAPSHVNVFMTSDYAVTDDGGDYTEHGVWGVADQNIYQLDWWHGQTTADVWIERGLDLVQRYKPLCWFGEGGVIQKAVEPYLMRRMTERRAFCRVEWVPSVRDKPTRARAFQARASTGNVSLLNDERGDRVLDQLLKFPAGKYDDAVDVCSLLGQVIDQAHPGVLVASAPPKSRDSYKPVVTQSDDSWRV